MRDAEKQSITFYENEAESYDNRRWNTPAGKYNDEVQKRIVLDLVGECDNISVLEIAAGTGRFALEFAKKGAKITVLDSSKNMLDLTRQKFEERGLERNLATKQGLATNLPMEDDSLDVCVCINAMNHIEGYAKVLEEIHRVLKPGGVSVTNYVNWLSPYLPFGLWVNLRKTSVTRDVYTKWFNPIEVSALHKAANMRVETTLGELHFPTGANNSMLFSFLKYTDQALRNRPFSFFAPQLFVKARK